MTWQYRISNGELTHDGEFIGTGYSGHGEGRNNPYDISIADTGPIPLGVWDIGPSYTDAIRGPIVMRLAPESDTETFGRSGFLIHGDNATHTASTGCIILGPAIRREIDQSQDKNLRVIA